MKETKRRDIPLTGATALLVVSTIFLLIVLTPSLQNRFFESDAISGSAGSFLGGETTSELETLSWVRRTVFPHDFYLAELSYNELLTRDIDSLSPEEYGHLRAASLAWDTRLALARTEGPFVVLTTVVTFYYDVDEIEFSVDEQRTTVRLPPQPRYRTVIEDIDRQNYPYGPVAIDAAELRLISEFVHEQIGSDPQLEELAMLARDNAVSILETLLVGDDRAIVFAR